MQRQRLAIDGGPRALEGPPAVWPLEDPRVRDALDAAWRDRSWGRYHGPHVETLSADLAEMHGVEHALPCCTGTFAVELALRAAKVGADDEVILAGYDFPGNFRAIEAIGARPVLVDLAPDDWIVDPDALAEAASARTRAILVSHLHGSLVDMPRLMAFAARRQLAVVEDACQATGAMIGGRMAGSWGDVGVLSFGGSKLLTAGRGGAILTRQPDVFQRAKIFCDRGNHAFALSELQAAVLLPQLKALGEQNDRRRDSVERLLGRLAGIPGLRRPSAGLAGAAPSYYKLAWSVVSEDLGGASREQFLAAAQAEGAPLDAGFRGFAGRGDRRCRKVGSLDHSRRAAEATIVLHHPILLEPLQRIDQLADALAKVARAMPDRQPTVRSTEE